MQIRSCLVAGVQNLKKLLAYAGKFERAMTGYGEAISPLKPPMTGILSGVFALFVPVIKFTEKITDVFMPKSEKTDITAQPGTVTAFCLKLYLALGNKPLIRFICSELKT